MMPVVKCSNSMILSGELLDKRLIKIGTRSSRLAVVQAERVAEIIRASVPECEARLELITSAGDRESERPLEQLGGEGLFTRALDDALCDGRVDCAVHSMKDLPTRLTPGTVIGAVPERRSPFDAYVSAAGILFDALESGAVVFAGSPRRRAFLRFARDNLEYVPVRGNVDTRMRKLREGEAAGLIVAMCALDRLSLEPTEVFDRERMIPAAGQGALAVTARGDDAQMLDFLAACDNQNARAEVTAERSLLRTIGAGCRTPVGVLGRAEPPERLLLCAAVLSPDGKKRIDSRAEGDFRDAEKIGRQLGRDLLDRGADVILGVK